jgi:hypothetical protein
MKFCAPFMAFMLTLCCAHGQVFIYDQESRTNQTPGSGFPIGFEQPVGQSFTPTLDSVGFVQFELNDYPGGSVGGNVYVNLWSGSLATGTLLGSTAPVFVPNGAFDLITTFLFSTPVTVSSGTTYYLQPILQSGDTTTMTIIGANTYNYSGGTLYENGSPDPNGSDAWFREGIVVPEPSAGILVLLGMAGIYFLRNGKRLFNH